MWSGCMWTRRKKRAPWCDHPVRPGLNVATGEVTGSIHRRHRAAGFTKFLTKLDTDIPAEVDIHLICDNYATHVCPESEVRRR